MSNTVINKSNNLVKNLWEYLLLLKESSVRTMLFLGFSAGLPYFLWFATLSLWLREAGLERSSITFFAWAGLGYSFKFIWAPLIDQARLPILGNKMGRRRSWLLLCQLLLILTIALMSQVNPIDRTSLTVMAILAVGVGFFSASQDIVIDAVRIEITPTHLLGMSSATYQLGYRIAILVSYAGALSLADYFGTSKEHYRYEAWEQTYLIMAACMLIGVVTTLLMKEPENNNAQLDTTGSKQLLSLIAILLVPFIAAFYLWNAGIGTLMDTGALGALSTFLLGFARFVFACIMCFLVAKWLIKSQLIPTQVATNAYWQPIEEFIGRYPTKTTILLLILIGFYRVSDVVLGTQAGLFYLDVGFSKTEIGVITKGFGLIMTFVGMFVGGWLIAKVGTIHTLMWGAILSALTNLLFMILAQTGEALTMLYIVISADNLAAGIATTAFITFLSRLTNIQFTAMQYAIFSSLMMLFPKIISGYSGTMVDASSYSTFFLITTLMGAPVIVLVYLVGKRLTLDEEK